MTDSTRSLKLFYCYAREDKDLRDRLETSLSGLKRPYNLTHWHDREISPGKEWERVIDEQINSADIIFLLISPDFIASDYCYCKEMQRALERHKAGLCCVIPILVRPIRLEEMPFGSILFLPTNGKAISSWRNRYEAFYNVAEGVSTAIKTLLSARETVITYKIEDRDTNEVEVIDTFKYFCKKGRKQKHYTFTLRNGKKIDIDTVQDFIMHSAYLDYPCYLDTQTGQGICSLEIGATDTMSDEEWREIEWNDRYIFIDKRVTASEQYQWMKDFVAKIVAPKDEQFSNILFNELEKYHPFQRFKTTLSAKWKQAWCNWEDYHITEEMNNWFESLPRKIRGK